MLVKMLSRSEFPITCCEMICTSAPLVSASSPVTWTWKQSGKRGVTGTHWPSASEPLPCIPPSSDPVCAPSQQPPLLQT